MALKLKMKIANNLVKPVDGIYEGEILELGLGVGVRTEKNGRDVEQIEYVRFEMIAAFPGTNEPIKIKTFTGSTLNGEPVEKRYAGRGAKNEVDIYNRYTTLLLALEVITVDELEEINEKTIERIEKSLESLKGKTIQCEIGKDKAGYYAIDLQTLKLKK